jgi:aldehyde dehydrogenase (NAD+)
MQTLEAENIINNTSEQRQTEIFKKQKKFFNQGKTKSYSFRKQQLQKLKAVFKENEKELIAALHTDFSKPEFEAYVTEIGFVYEEINYNLKYLKRWMQPKKVPTSILHFPSKSRIYYEPKGVCLIIGPWNYPFQLVIAPLVAAIAAGNCAMIKPPEQTPLTSKLLEKIISENFEEEFIAVINGEGKTVVPQLMNAFTFDHVFFTGSVAVGKIIAKMAAEKLVPTTLELGGKSPAVVDKSANKVVSARRIVYGKMINAGQTCVAPDYLLVHNSIKEEFVDELRACFMEFYSISPTESKDLTAIVNNDRLIHLKEISDKSSGKKTFGGTVDDSKRKMDLQIVENVDIEDPLMQEEIFGPILPVLGYDTTEEAISIIEKNPNPLAFYVFSENSSVSNQFIEKVPFGGGAVNNTVLHLSNPNLPFGGRGNSGSGNYHGHAGFLAFSHEKSVLRSGTWFDLKTKYPPFNENSMKLIRFFFK